MKKIILALSMLLFILVIGHSNAEHNPIAFTCNTFSGKEISIPFETLLKDIPMNLVKSFAERKMPYWSIPGTNTEKKSGYVGVNSPTMSYSLYYHGYPMQSYNLYCIYDYDDQGNAGKKDNAIFYMAEMVLNTSHNNSSQEKFNQFIDEINSFYGSPTKTEKQIGEGLIITTTGMSSYKIYEKTLAWHGANKTELQVIAQYDTNKKEYNSIQIRLGKTNYDRILKEGKMIEEPTYMETATKASSVLMKKANGDLIQDMKPGTRLLVLSYEPSLDKFYAQIVGTQYEGYISGKGLIISREDLLSAF